MNRAGQYRVGFLNSAAEFICAITAAVRQAELLKKQQAKRGLGVEIPSH